MDATPPINLLAVSIGNTRVRMGAFVQGELSDTATIEHGGEDAIGEAVDQVYAHMQDREHAGVLLASVVPSLTATVSRVIEQRVQRPVHRVEADLPIPIGRQTDAEALVGEDRLLNAAAAFDVLKQACIVVDAGTAMTVDYVDGAGTFHGGAILPGGQSMLDTMNAATAQLPAIELAKPDEAIGHNTTQAMLTGVFHALRGAVHELVEAYAEQTGGFPLVVATGGDANLVFRGYELVDRIVPNLTLTGMLVTWRHALEQRAAQDN